LFFLHKKSYQEVADITGYDLGKVKSYIQNGKRNLRIYLENRNAG
jgi:DNA-directed RNA polymerase specialized sigma24 family protein